MNYNTALCLVCRVEIVQTGLLLHRPGSDRPGSDRPGSAPYGQTSPEAPELGRAQEPAQVEESLSAGYTSTPLIRDPSKTMVKSWMVCRIRIRELTVMWSRRSALSSYMRVMAGHSASNGIHCGSRWSLQVQTETAAELPVSFPLIISQLKQ